MLKRIQSSFAARLQIHILFFLTLLFAMSSAIFYHYANRFIETNAYENFNHIAEKTNLRMTRLLRMVEKIPNNMGWVITEYIQDPNTIYSIRRQIVESNDEIFGCAIAFEPYYFTEKGKYFAPYSYMEGDSVITTELDDAYDYYQKNWYRIAKEKNTSRWSRPYHDFGNRSVMTTTYSVPLKDQNENIIGVFSVDLSLQYIGKFIEANIDYPGGYTIVVDKNGNYVISTLDCQLIKNVTAFDVAAGMKDPSAMDVAHRIVSGETGKGIFYDKGIKSYAFYSPIIGTEWYMAIICPYDEIFVNLRYFHFIVLFSFILFMIAIYLISSLSIKKITAPLNKFALSARCIASGNFNAPLPKIRSCDEMKELHDSFQYMQNQLTQYIANLKEATTLKEKMESELRIAHQIQMGMLPKNFSTFSEKENLDLFAILYPAKAVGGDFYDFFMIGDELYFAIGDVSGKGIPASLLMSYTLSLLRSFSTNPTSPSDIARYLNNRITERNEADMFVTFFIGTLNLKTGLLKYSNAGHMPPVMTYPDRSISFFDIHAELPLGIIKDYTYEEYSYMFSPGSGILLYTDGVTEAENAKNEFYTKERLISIVHTNRELHPREFIKKIMADIQAHVQDYEQSDDLTLLTIIYGEEWMKDKK